MAGLSNFLQTVFKIRPEEASRTGAACLYLFASVGAFIISRITRTVLFLEIPGYREKLPLMYIIQAVAVSAAMYVYSRYERKLRRDQTNVISLAIIIVANLGFRWLLEFKTETVYGIFYVWVEIFGTFLIVQFWSFANEIFHSREAKRLFALIGGGGVLANVVIGFGIKGSVAYLGTENLVFVICICLSVSLVTVWYLGKIARTELDQARERRPAKTKEAGKSKGQPGKVFATRHVQLIALVVVVTYLVSTLVDYQFQVIIGDSIQGKDDRTAYFGAFFGITGIFAGIIQFFVTSRFLERFGVFLALLMLPVAMTLGSLSLLTVPVLLPALWAIAATKGSENTLRYSINDTTLQLLYLPVPAHIRGRSKAFIDGILKPVSIGAAGLVLGILTGTFEKMTGIDIGLNVDVTTISWVVLVGLALWIASLVGLRREYVQSLMQTLQRRRLNFADARFQISDDSTIKILGGALESNHMGEVLHALELLSFVASKSREPLDEKVGELLLHESDDVRVAALDYWATHGASLHAGDVAELLQDPSAKVRGAATRAYCALAREAALQKVHPLLDDADLSVRATAVAGLIRHGGLDGVLSCADVLKGMLASDKPANREKAAWILGEVGVQNFYQPLMPLFDDEFESVRLAAIEAAGALKSPNLLTSLLPQLNNGRVAGATVAALASYGDSVCDAVAEVLSDDAKPAAMRCQAARVLARLGDSRAAEILSEHLSDHTGSVRTASVNALAHIVHHSPGIQPKESQVREALRGDSRAYFELLALEMDLELGDEAVLLNDAIEHRKELARGRLFALLSLEYPAKTIDLVTRNLKSAQASTRANAVEVLDNLLDKSEKPYIIPIVDDAPVDRTLVVGRDLFSLPRASRLDRLTELLTGKDDWLQVCAAMAVADLKEKSLADEVKRLLDSHDATCRETAIVALLQIGLGSDLDTRLQSLTKDPVPSVRRYAGFALKQVVS